MTKQEAELIVGTLSKPSKMPCLGYSTPAKECKTGAKLRGVKGSICNICYALKGRYVFKNVMDAMVKRFKSLFDKRWVEAISFLIGKTDKNGFFRWHDSGDLQGVWHLEKICAVAKKLPHIKFWLPTREYSMVADYIKNVGPLPENLIVRLSALMLEGNGPEAAAKRLGVQVSSVSKTGYSCPAPKQKNECGDCRACWNKDVFDVSYKQH